MMALYTIRIERTPGPEPLTGEHILGASENVEVEAESLWQARNRSMLFASIKAHGRLLRFYNAEDGKEILR